MLQGFEYSDISTEEKKLPKEKMKKHRSMSKDEFMDEKSPLTSPQSPVE